MKTKCSILVAALLLLLPLCAMAEIFQLRVTVNPVGQLGAENGFDHAFPFDASGSTFSGTYDFDGQSVRDFHLIADIHHVSGGLFNFSLGRCPPPNTFGTCEVALPSAQVYAPESIYFGFSPSPSSAYFLDLHLNGDSVLSSSTFNFDEGHHVFIAGFIKQVPEPALLLWLAPLLLLVLKFRKA